MKIEKFDQKTAVAFKGDFEKVLKKFAAERNVEISTTNEKVAEDHIGFKINARVVSQPKSKEEQLEAQTKKFCQDNKLDRNKHGRQLLSYDTRKWRKPVLWKDVDGSMHASSIDQAKMIFKRET